MTMIGTANRVATVAALAMVWAAHALPVVGQGASEARLRVQNLVGLVGTVPEGVSSTELNISWLSARKMRMDVGAIRKILAEQSRSRRGSWGLSTALDIGDDACGDLGLLGMDCRDDVEAASAAEFGNDSELADLFHFMLSDLSTMGASSDMSPQTQGIDWVSTEVDDAQFQNPQFNDYQSYGGGLSGAWFSATGDRYGNGGANGASNATAQRPKAILPAWLLKWQTWLVVALVGAVVLAPKGSSRPG